MMSPRRVGHVFKIAIGERNAAGPLLVQQRLEMSSALRKRQRPQIVAVSLHQIAGDQRRVRAAPLAAFWVDALLPIRSQNDGYTLVRFRGCYRARSVDRT